MFSVIRFNSWDFTNGIHHAVKINLIFDMG